VKFNWVLFFIILLTSQLCAAELDENRTYKVAFAQDTLNNDFRFAQVKVLQQIFSQYSNVDFVYSDAKSNVAIQIKQIEDFMYRDIDLLMVSPYYDDATTEAVAKVYRAGIPVVLVSRKVKGNEYSTYIHPDNKQIAHDAAVYLAKKMDYQGRVLLLKGVPKTAPARLRSEGFFEVISQYPKIEVIERTANYLRREAIIEVEKLLNQEIHFSAIMSQSDSMLVGARMALSAHGIEPASLITVGIDYIQPAQNAIRSGQQDSSFVYALCAKESAEAALRILAGEVVPKEIKIGTVQVTKENVDVVEPIF